MESFHASPAHLGALHLSPPCPLACHVKRRSGPGSRFRLCPAAWETASSTPRLGAGPRVRDQQKSSPQKSRLQTVVTARVLMRAFSWVRYFYFGFSITSTQLFLGAESSFLPYWSLGYLYFTLLVRSKYCTFYSKVSFDSVSKSCYLMAVPDSGPWRGRCENKARAPAVVGGAPVHRKSSQKVVFFHSGTRFYLLQVHPMTFFHYICWPGSTQFDQVVIVIRKYNVTWCFGVHFKRSFSKQWIHLKHRNDSFHCQIWAIWLNTICKV